MIIGGLQRFTLSDFPGKPAAIIFFQGCNFRCPFCHNGSLLPMRPESPPVPVTDITNFLEERRGRLCGVVLSGGEPTMQNDLEKFIEGVRSIGYAVKLDTNGSRPEIIAKLIQNNLLDYIAMDIKAPPEKYATLCGTEIDYSAIRHSIKIISAGNVPHHFRTTFVPSLLSRDDLKNIRSSLPANTLYNVQQFRKENALVSGL